MTEDILNQYSMLIQEAFITPIRTVTVIDDEYPTLLSLLNKSDEDAKENHSINIERLKKIIEMCHSNYKWSVDVFDGNTPKIGNDDHLPQHIHHSDLIVLDYHLEGNDSTDGGARARRIIDTLNNNSHYNLTLVHTKGTGEDIKRVFIEILKELFKINTELTKNFELTSEEQIKIDEWLDRNEDGSKYQWIREEACLYEVFKIYAYPDVERYMTPCKPSNPLNPFKEDIGTVAKEIGLTIQKFTHWIFSEQLTRNNVEKIKFPLDLKFEWNEKTNFISTDNIFISVIPKGTEDPEIELIESLKRALDKHRASPMHLIMAKMRYELDERGIGQASKIISNELAQAGWLYNLLNDSDSDYAHDKAINLHWEQLAAASRLKLRNFSKKITSCANKTDENKKKFVEYFFPRCMREQDNILAHINTFSCSMPVSNSHLITGTVLDIESEKWVCVSPACDLVPGQKNQEQNYMVFKAIKFTQVALSTANEKVNENGYIYLNIDNELQAFSIGGGNPHWRTFYADDQGRYNNDGYKNKLSLTYIRENTSTANNLEIVPVEAIAIAELRYPYALNFQYRFGSSQTRIGLDFQGQSSLWK